MKKNTSRFIICVYYDQEGKLRHFMDFLLKSLKGLSDGLLLVVNGNLDEESRLRVRDIGADILIRSNSGYDFHAYREGYEYFRNSKYCDVDELVFCNSSCYGPLNSLEPIFSEMNKKNVDFWGLTQWRSKPWPNHIQSYFLVFKKTIYQSSIFDLYWKTLPELKNRQEAIQKCEVLLTQYFEKQGFRWDTFIPPLRSDYCMTYVLDGLEKGHPFLKRKFFSSNDVTESAKREVIVFLQKKTKYDPFLIYEDFFYTTYTVDSSDKQQLRTYLKLKYPRLYLLFVYIKNSLSFRC